MTDQRVIAVEAGRPAASGQVVPRRLNRIEYRNSVRGLPGIDIDLKERLPLDNSAGGFDNVGEALHTLSFLMDRDLNSPLKMWHDAPRRERSLKIPMNCELLATRSVAPH